MTKSRLAIAAVAFVGVALLAVGAFAMVAPGPAAGMFGVTAISSDARAYVWATGTRDVAIGVWLLLLVGLRVGPRALAASILALALVPAGDVTNVFANAGTESLFPLALHGVSVAAFVAFGVWLWRSDRDTAPTTPD